MTAQIAQWWTALWPNLVASALWALPGFTINHLLLRRHHQRTADQQTQQIKDHIDARIEGRQP